jgi:hypothetical protein
MRSSNPSSVKIYGTGLRPIGEWPCVSSIWSRRSCAIHFAASASLSPYGTWRPTRGRGASRRNTGLSTWSGVTASTFCRRATTTETPPNPPLEPTAGRNWVLNSKLSSARRGSAARRSACQPRGMCSSGDISRLQASGKGV